MTRARWALVPVALVGLSACTYTTRATEPTTTAAPSATTLAVGPTIDVAPQADLVRTYGGPALTGERSLVIEPLAGSALVSFPLGELDPTCVGSASLEAVALADGDGAETLAWVSLEQEVDALVDGQSLGTVVIAKGSPSAEPTRSKSLITWDVRELVSWSASVYPQGSALVFVLKPNFNAAQGAPVELGSIEGGAAAVLHVNTLLDCP